MEIEIEIRAISGELEMSFTMLDTEHFQDLQQRVIQQLTSERGLPRLLLEGQALEPPARSSLKSLGILPPKGVFQLIRVRPPAECVCSYHVAIGQEGYHVHDSFLRQVPSVDPKAFYICWRRSFSEKGGSFQGHINLIRNKVYPTGCSLREEVVLNTTRTATARIKDQAMLFRMEADYLQRGPATLAILGGKALMNVVSSSGTSHLRASGPTVELVLVQPGQSERQVMWRHAEDEKLMAAFEGRLQMQKFYVAEDQRTYAVGSRTNRNGGPMAGRVILRCDLDLEWGRLSFPEWADVEKCGPLSESSSGGFAGSDKEGKRLYFFEEHSGYEQLTIYSISTETLGERVEVLLPEFDFEKENGDTKWVVLDPKTQDLYFLHDFALQYASLLTDNDDNDSDAPVTIPALEGGPTCSVYRLRCNPDAELGRRYESSSYDLICHACLEIDGFSDSFSVALAAYDSDQDCLVIFDAGEQLWCLPLREARWQDPLEE